MAFEPAPLLIGLREGMEALLVLGILLGMLDRLGARDRRPLVWAGFGAGIAVSIAAGILVDRVFSARFEQGGAAVFEVVVALAAVGVLSYMVLWMQRNASNMAQGIRARVLRAVAGRQVWALAFLGFVTVVREGLEVVLFYSALSTSLSWADIALWGAVGFAASAVLAYAVFQWTVQVRLHTFFAVSGLLLVFIAAGLLVHVVHAAAELGWIGHATPLWDTSATLPDEDHWLGGPLHALVGYEDQPTMLQLVLYVGYLTVVGGTYLLGLRPGPRPRSRMQQTGAVAIIGTLLLLAVAAAVPTEDGPGAVAGHGHASFQGDVPEHLDLEHLAQAAIKTLEEQDLRVGVLIRSHGEPQHYNATTYHSFKQFIIDIWPYTGLPDELLSVDAGTYYIDEKHPFADDMYTDHRLVDAWLGAPPLPTAVPVVDPLGTGVAELAGGTFYFLPGAGDGLGEGDVFEVLALGVYRTWLKMENFSPKVLQTEDHFVWLAAALQQTFGDRMSVESAYSIDPHTTPDRNLERAVQRLVATGPDVILDSYMSSVHSDAMDTCMMRPHAHHTLQEAGFDGPIVQVGMAGTHPAWGEAVAAYLQQEAQHFAGHGNVSVYLSQHGARPGSPNPCGEGTDQYHDNLRAQYAAVTEILQQRFGDRFTFRHVYGSGADDPDDGALSPLEALELDREAGVDHVVIVPYEFWSDAMDNLVPLRESLGFEAHQAPYYDSANETHLTLDGVHIDVWSAHYAVPLKGTALVARIAEAIEGLDVDH